MQLAVALVCSVLLATAGAKECSQDELVGCQKSIDLFVTDRKELTAVCEDLLSSLECVERYTMKCMTKLQRDHFLHLYSGTIMVITDLCKEGAYKEEYLRHAPCMRAVHARYEDCAAAYRHSVPSSEPSSQLESDAKLRHVCCSFQQYLSCSMGVVKNGCGPGTANFTRQFLNRMARPVVEGHCEKFSGDCDESGSAPASGPPLALLATLSALWLATLAWRP